MRVQEWVPSPDGFILGALEELAPELNIRGGGGRISSGKREKAGDKAEGAGWAV